MYAPEMRSSFKILGAYSSVRLGQAILP